MDQSSSVTVVDWKADLDSSLNRERVRSEIRRSTILLGVCAFFWFVVAILLWVPGVMDASVYEQLSKLGVPFMLALTIAVGYESGLQWSLRRLLRRQEQPSSGLTYCNALIETLLPTYFLYVGIQNLGPIQALLAPPSLFYFLLIFLATLQLNPWLCLFTGAVSAAQYLLLVHLYVEPSAILPEVAYITAPHQYVVRGIFYVVAGMVGAFVASQIKKQMMVSIRTLKERDLAVNIFGQHVSPEVAKRLLNQPMDTAGEVRNVCVMFLDIRNFSVYACDHTPEEVMDYLNTLFGGMIEIVNNHNGIVNKFLGDGFMAVFGAPVDDNKQCEHAAKAAMEIIQAVNQMNTEGRIPTTRVGIGLHRGEAVTGNVGSHERKEYTIIGDVVNLASRIEQATKRFDGQVLVSDQVWTVLNQEIYSAVDLGMVELKGQAKPIRLYQLA